MVDPVAWLANCRVLAGCQTPQLVLFAFSNVLLPSRQKAWRAVVDFGSNCHHGCFRCELTRTDHAHITCSVTGSFRWPDAALSGLAASAVVVVAAGKVTLYLGAIFQNFEVRASRLQTLRFIECAQAAHSALSEVAVES